MYLGFYIGALANLAEIEDLFAALPPAIHDLHHPHRHRRHSHPRPRLPPLRRRSSRAPRPRKIPQALAIPPALDVLWSLSPFLLLHHINFGLALACTALLVYSPFAQRSLILMGAGSENHETPATTR